MQMGYTWDGYMILDSKWGDVTGDGFLDYVFLTGRRFQPSSPYMVDITLMIQDGRTGRITRVPLENNSGYSPMLFLGDFTGDKVSDIQVSIASGGSGGYYFNYIFSAKNNQVTKLFDSDVFNEQFQYEVNYLDNYKVQVVSLTLDQEFILDITYKGQDYLDQLYDVNGQLIRPVQGNVYGLVNLYPVDVDNDGVYELQIWQEISGLYHADGLGYVLTFMRWDESDFEPYMQMVAIFGADL